jgi:TM2 domain-containing membrane protein YozV
MTQLIRFFRSLVLFLSLSGLYSGASAQNLYDAAHSEKYAGHLYSTKNYSAAAREYKRLALYRPADDTVIQKILTCYRLQGLPDSGIAYMKLHYPETSSAPGYINNEFAKSLILAGRYGEADSLLMAHNQLDSFSINRYKFYNKALSDHWDDARNIFAHNSLAINSNTDAWRQLLKKQAALTYKSPALAMSLSIIIPGAGKIYAGDWKDGTVALLLVGSMAYESYVGFHTRGTKSVLGYAFGGLALGYYGGNIYGSYKSAVRYNRRKNLEIHNDAEKLVGTGL